MADRWPKVGVFDSGVGGLSILKAIASKIPNVDLLFCCDNKNYPYGSKSENKVVELVTESVSVILSECAPDILVIACNTASTVALPGLRKRFGDIPIVGVVPAIKPASSLTKTKIIGLLATPGTVNRRYTDDLIKTYAQDCKVIKVGSSALVDYAEQKLRGMSIAVKCIKDEIGDFFGPENNSEEKKIDTIVLGCTHFPLLMEELTQASSWPVHWVDSREAIANRVRTLLDRGNKNKYYRPISVVTNVFPTKRHVFFTKKDPNSQSLEHNFLIKEGFLTTYLIARRC